MKNKKSTVKAWGNLTVPRRSAKRPKPLLLFFAPAQYSLQIRQLQRTSYIIRITHPAKKVKRATPRNRPTFSLRFCRLCIESSFQGRFLRLIPGKERIHGGVLSFLYTPDLFLEADVSACFAVLSWCSQIRNKKRHSPAMKVGLCLLLFRIMITNVSFSFQNSRYSVFHIVRKVKCNLPQFYLKHWCRKHRFPLHNLYKTSHIQME